MNGVKLFCEHCGAPLMTGTAELRRIRLEKGIQTKALAGKIGISFQYLSTFEMGHRQPSRDILERWVKALS